MKILRRVVRVLGFFIAVVSLVGCQITKSMSTPLDVTPVHKMPVPEVDPTVAHFDKLDQCVDHEWNESGLPRPVFGIGKMPNNTGRFQASAEKTAGYQETLDGSYFLSRAMEGFGFERVTRKTQELEMVLNELKFGRDGLLGDGKIYSVGGRNQVHRPVMHGQVKTYDIGIDGQFTSDDAVPGENFSVGAWGAWVGKRAAASRIAVDITAFDAVGTSELTTVGVASQVVVHDYQAGINRFLAKPMTILIGMEYGTTQIGMHDIAGRLMTKLALYRMLATLNPHIAQKCNRYTGGFMTDNPGARYPDGLVNKVMKRPVGPAIVEKSSEKSAPEKKLEAPKKQMVSVFVPCGEGEGDYHCVMGETARVRTEDIKRRVQAGAEVKQIIGFTASPTLRTSDPAHGLTHAQDYARLLPITGSTVVRAATQQDLDEIHAPHSSIRGNSGVIIEFIENAPSNTPGNT